MRRKQFLAAILGVAVWSHILAAMEGPEPVSSCSIRISISGFEGGLCKFLGVFGNQNYLALPEFTATAEDILIENNDLFPAGLYYLVFPNDVNLQLLLDKDQTFSMQTTIRDPVGDMQISGSLDNELLYRNLQYEVSFKQQFELLTNRIDEQATAGHETAELEEQRQSVIDQRQDHIRRFVEEHPESFFTKFKIAGQNPQLEYPLLPDGEVDKEKQLELYRSKFWDGVDFNDARILRTPVFHNKLNRYINELTPQRVDDVIAAVDTIMAKAAGNPDLYTYTVSYLCLQYLKSPIMGGEAIYVHLVDHYLADGREHDIPPDEVRKARDKAQLMRPSLLGSTGQNIRALNQEGEYESLYDLDAPIVDLYIYNVECDHCQEETPRLKVVYDQWKSRGVDVFALSTNQDLEAWKSYIEQEKLDWHNVIDPEYESRYYSKYYVDVTPEVYVLNEDKEIIGMNLRSEQLEFIFTKELEKMRLSGPMD